MDSGALIENWAAICSKVKEYEGIDASQINAFFSRLEPQAMSEGFLMLTADNDFIKTWIERHYVEVIRRALQDTYGLPSPSSSRLTQPPCAQAPAMQPMNQQSVQYAAPQNQASRTTSLSRRRSTTTRCKTPTSSTPPLKNATAMQGVPATSRNAASCDAASRRPDPRRNPQAQSWAGNGGAQPGFNPQQGKASTVRAFTPTLPRSSKTPPIRGGFPAGANSACSRPIRPPTPRSARPTSQREQSRTISKKAARRGGFRAPLRYERPSFDHYIDRSAPSQETAGNGTRSNASTGSGDHPTSTLTFENFVIGDSNRMAYSMAVDVAEMPERRRLTPCSFTGRAAWGKPTPHEGHTKLHLRDAAAPQNGLRRLGRAFVRLHGRKRSAR